MAWASTRVGAAVRASPSVATAGSGIIASKAGRPVTDTSCMAVTPKIEKRAKS